MGAVAVENYFAAAATAEIVFLGAYGAAGLEAVGDVEWDGW